MKRICLAQWGTRVKKGNKCQKKLCNIYKIVEKSLPYIVKNVHEPQEV